MMEESAVRDVLVSGALLSRIAVVLGAPVLSWRRVGGGYSPALRLLCESGRGTFFVKIGVTPLTATFLRREFSVYSRIRGAFVPELVGFDDDGVTPILALEALSGADDFWPPPWNASRVDRVSEQIAAMHATGLAAGTVLEPYAQVHGDGLHGEGVSGWSAVARDAEPFLSVGFADRVWLARALSDLIAAESSCSTAGESLTHWDLRSDNLCLRRDRVVFIDWNLACRSNPILDLGFWLPSLAAEGGPPPEALLPDAPDVAAWVAGFFASRAGLPQIPDAPRVRWVQRQQLAIALVWAARALGLPTPTPTSLAAENAQ